MIAEEIQHLLGSPSFKQSCGQPNLIETHISWVILCNKYAYKIKKPIQYSFLDFSTLEKRKFYCEEEVRLNKRLSEEMYLGVGVIIAKEGDFEIKHAVTDSNKTIDYVVVMKRQDVSWQMDTLVNKGKVSEEMLLPLIDVLVSFHKGTKIVHKKDLYSVQHNFDDIAAHKEFVAEKLGEAYSHIIIKAIDKSSAFIHAHQQLLQNRSQEGFVKDCHGDLHARNIFLNPKRPVVFDCIEFNDDIRQIDVLNELAFFCMDLEALDQAKLSEYFISNYNNKLKVIRNEEEKKLFIYYKSYRANVRAKVNILRAQSSPNEISETLEDCKLYLNLMNDYINQLL